MTSALVDCPACNNPVSRSAPACPRCGHAVREDLSRGAVVRRSDGSGVAAASDTTGLLGMICGVVSLGVAFIPSEISLLAVVLSLLAVIFSSVSLSRTGRGEASGRGMALTGLVTGILGLLIFLLAVTFLYTLFRDEL